MLSYSPTPTGFSVQCPRCGGGIQTGHEKCDRCDFVVGYALSEAKLTCLPRGNCYSPKSKGFQLPCPRCAATIYTAMPECPGCQYPIGYGMPQLLDAKAPSPAKISVPGQAATPTEPPRKKPWWKRLLKIAGLTYLGAVLLTGYFGENFAPEKWPRLNHVMNWLWTPVKFGFTALIVIAFCYAFWAIGVVLLHLAIESLFPKRTWTKGKAIPVAVAIYAGLFGLAGLGVWKEFYFGWSHGNTAAWVIMIPGGFIIALILLSILFEGGFAKGVKKVLKLFKG